MDFLKRKTRISIRFYQRHDEHLIIGQRIPPCVIYWMSTDNRFILAKLYPLSNEIDKSKHSFFTKAVFIYIAERKE